MTNFVPGDKKWWQCVVRSRFVKKWSRFLLETAYFCTYYKCWQSADVLPLKWNRKAAKFTLFVIPTPFVDKTYQLSPMFAKKGKNRTRIMHCLNDTILSSLILLPVLTTTYLDSEQASSSYTCTVRPYLYTVCIEKMLTNSVQ